jgi:HEPN domain-containing protein
MISTKDLKSAARAYLRDARVLLEAKRYDGAYYLCGYAVELALKARICRTLRWDGFPQTRAEFEGRQSLKTHDLEDLLQFTGVGARVKTKYFAEWSFVLNWNPEKRYQKTGNSTQQDAADMVTSAKKLLAVL